MNKLLTALLLLPIGCFGSVKLKVFSGAYYGTYGSTQKEVNKFLEKREFVNCCGDYKSLYIFYKEK
jgi:hypothetical protein